MGQNRHTLVGLRLDAETIEAIRKMVDYWDQPGVENSGVAGWCKRIVIKEVVRRKKFLKNFL